MLFSTISPIKNEVDKKHLPVNFTKIKSLENKESEKGEGFCRALGFSPNVELKNIETEKCKNEPKRILQIIETPKPEMTDDARANNIKGVVRVRVTFSASGNVTSVNPISSLPFGLTEEAQKAARRIKFKPALKCGNPVAVSKVVEYRFGTD